MPKTPPIKWTAETWTQADLDDLHDMVKDYQHARWFRRRLRVWLWMILGAPPTFWVFWEPLVKAYNSIRLLVGIAP